MTGGSGFLGGRLISALKERGHAVRALARSDQAMKTVGAAGAQPIEGDLARVEALTAGMEGCEWVFHSAARVFGSRRGDFIEDNLRGTERVLEAARAAGVKRLIHISSQGVVLGNGPLVNVDETRPIPEQGLGPYSHSKGRAEALVLSCNGAGLETVAVRPPMIWGAGDTTSLPKLALAVKERRFRWIGGGHHQVSTCHVDNVVHGTLLAAEKGRGGQAYFLSDGEPLTFRDFMSQQLQAVGVTPPSASTPFWVAKLVAVASEALWHVAFPGELPVLYRERLLVSGVEMTVNDAKARAELGYLPQVTREQGLAALRESAGAGPPR